MGLDNLKENITSALDTITDGISGNPVASSLGAGALILGGVGVALAVSGAKSKARNKRTSRGRSRDRKFKSKQKHEQRYKRKRKFKVYKSKNRKSRKSKRGIHYTKKGQPYKIMANGRARFIKK